MAALELAESAQEERRGVDSRLELLRSRDRLLVASFEAQQLDVGPAELGPLRDEWSVLG
jgi:hypothetical protein